MMVERPPLPEEPPVMAQPPFPADAPPVPAEAAPAAGTLSPASGGAAWWRALAEECKGRLPPMYRAFLDKCKGQLENGTITVYAPDEIVRGRLDNERVFNALQELGAMKAGGEVRIHLVVGTGPSASPEDRLQDLIQLGSQLDNFTIQ